MARLGFPTSRSGGQRWRALVAAGLIGGIAVMAPSTHLVHAAALQDTVNCKSNPSSSYTVDPINSAAQSQPFTQGSVSLLVDGSAVTLSANNPAVPDPLNPGYFKLSYSQSPGYANVNGACSNTYDSGGAHNPDNITAYTPFAYTVNNITTTCDYVTTDVFTVGAPNFGDHQSFLQVNLHCSNGSTYFLTATLAAGGSVPTQTTPTPELGSGELLATGIVPILGIAFLRRRRRKVQQ